MTGAKNYYTVLLDTNKDSAINNLLGATFSAANQRCMDNSMVLLAGKARTERLIGSDVE